MRRPFTLDDELGGEFQIRNRCLGWWMGRRLGEECGRKPLRTLNSGKPEGRVACTRLSAFALTATLDRRAALRIRKQSAGCKNSPPTV
jgi:hypothetical protein